jgi:hypothetical protein
MAADLAPLIPEFRSKVDDLIGKCRQRGIEMRPFFALRTPFEQAKLWRQSRTREEIDQRIAALRSTGAGFLAHCIESVGSQHGAHVTNAIPGLSWHQWGEALDCMWIVERQAEWSTTRTVNGLNGYQVYADEAAALGLSAGGHWTSFKDWPHVQQRALGSPDKVMTVKDIDGEMQRRFGS